MDDAVARDLRAAARHLLQHPLTCAEQDPDAFALIRRHEDELDRRFTHRLGYRLHVSGGTARLFKSTLAPHRRTLSSAGATPRALSRRELVLLALVLAAVASGPRVVSLRDLVTDVRVAAADADVELGAEAADRRAFVTVLRWMIRRGLVAELHEEVGRYEADAEADAILEIDPDRVALLPLPALARADSAAGLLDRSEARASSRRWMRARLVEDPVLYRDDLTEPEWTELRHRLSEETALLDEMFGLRLEARAEGIAAIDPEDRLSDIAFPSTRTVNHAALLLIDALAERGGEAARPEIEPMLGRLARRHARHWSKAQVESLGAFAERTLEVLADMRLLAERDGRVRLLPAAARFVVEHREPAEAHAGADVSASASAPKRKPRRRRPGADAQASLF